jgi:hypothetical protein
MCNCLLSLGGFVMLCATLRELFGRDKFWDWLAFGMFVPSLAYYDATPAKEPLTHFLYFSALFLSIKIVWANRYGYGPLALLMIGILAMVRTNAALLLIAANMWPIARRFGFFRSVLAACLLIAVAVGAQIYLSGGSASQVWAILDSKALVDSAQRTVAERAESETNGLKLLVQQALVPKATWDLFAYAPLRTVIWFYLPFPFLIPNFNEILPPPTLFFEVRLAKILAIHDLCFVISGWVSILATPYIIGFFLRAWKDRGVSAYSTLALNFLFPAVIIANAMFVMGRRYQVLIVPLVLAISLVAIRRRMISRWGLLCSLVLSGGVVAIALARAM